MTALRPLRAAALPILGLVLAPPLSAQQAPAPAATPAPTPAYAGVAALVTASPLVIDATIRSESRIKGAEASGVAAGAARFYV